MDYRQIWIRANGEIPKDVDGITYEIHHIDGNRSNNNLDNLECLSIEEHYRKHLEQKDFAQASAVLARMKKLRNNIPMNDRPLRGTKWYTKGDKQIQLSPDDPRITKEGWKKGMHPDTIKVIREKSHKASRVNYKDKEARNKKISNSLKDTYRSGKRVSNSRSVINLETGIKYNSLLEASKKTGISMGTISSHCNNKVKKVKWKFNL